jgi:hypothetical protein
MKSLLLNSTLTVLICLTQLFAKGQNCPQGGCSISVTVNQDSCPSSPQTLLVNANYSYRVCASNVPSTGLPDNAPCSPDPSNVTGCPSSSYRTANVSTSFGCGILNPMTSTSIKSVYYKLADSSLINYLGQPTAIGQDFTGWLKSPAGTYLLLNSQKPFNQNYSNPNGNYCYCPTFTPAGTSGTTTNADGPFNECNYTPEGGGLGVVFVGENPSGTWRLYVNDGVSGQSHGQARIVDFCITFEAVASSNSTYTWTSDSANCLAYLSNLNTQNPVFTPPAGYYDCTYYVTVYDSVCGCSGADTVHLSCPNTIGIESLSNSSIPFSVSINDSHYTFHYPSSSTKREIIINDVNGREVARYALAANSSIQTVNLPQMSAGVYVARLISNSAVPVSNVKFVVE